MLILLEGVDGSGKSTLAQTIADQLAVAFPMDKVELWHAGPPKGEHPLDLYEKPLWDYVPGTGRHIICDRWHLGEWIYPEVFDRESSADTATLRHIDMFLQSRGAVLVHATPPIETVIANVQERGDDLVNVRQLSGIHAAYSAMVQTSFLPTIRHSNIGNPFIPGETIRLARHMEAKAKQIAKFVTYVGPLRPKFLLLGDVRHMLRHDAPDLFPDLTRQYGPAFGPYLGTSGHFLLKHIPYELFRAADGHRLARGFGLANACDVDNPAEMWEALGKPATVALGQNAARCAPWAAKRHHPAYVRRFDSANGQAYGQAIAEVLGV